jgi:hypothetical protein
MLFGVSMDVGFERSSTTHMTIYVVSLNKRSSCASLDSTTNQPRHKNTSKLDTQYVKYTIYVTEKIPMVSLIKVFFRTLFFSQSKLPVFGTSHIIFMTKINEGIKQRNKWIHYNKQHLTLLVYHDDDVIVLCEKYEEEESIFIICWRSYVLLYFELRGAFVLIIELFHFSANW